MSFDFAVIGAGIAGASIAAHLARHGRVLLIEAERTAGYHTTGRSAAFWEETYGGPGVQPLTHASHGFLAAPPAEFAETGFLRPRGALYLARAEELAALDDFAATYMGQGVPLVRLDRAAMEGRVPELGRQWAAGVLNPGCCDIDVAGLHAAYLRQARRHGAEARLGVRLVKAERKGSGWRIEAGADSVEAGLLVNAAGAWADDVAAIAGVARKGIGPLRRTMVQARLNRPLPDAMPLTLALDGSFYVKPEGGARVWLTPQDEHPATPGDVAAEEADVALAIARVEAAFGWRVEAVERRWAGLRSFAADRLPVIGPDPSEPRFFWFAGQGGFGIQAAPAAAMLAEALITGQPPPEGLAPATFRPDRFA